MSKAKTVVLFDEDCDSMVYEWTDRLTVSLNARKRLTVKLSKYGEDPDRAGSRRWMAWDKSVGLTTPTQVLDAIESMEDDQSLSLDWAEAITLIAELDWIIAAIMAVKKEVQLPALPTTDELDEQRSLITLGKVTVAVEWGYEIHELTLRIEDWIDILSGYGFSDETVYFYEGRRYRASWDFSMDGDQPYLEVSYSGDGDDDDDDDDDGTGWCGKLRPNHLLNTTSIDGYDVAQLLLKAAITVESL